MDRVQRLATALPAVRLPRIPIRGLIATALTVFLLGGGWLWFRDSSLVRIKTVSVIGLSTNEAPQVRAALSAVAKNMSTLHVDRTALEQSVSRFPSVAGLRIQTDFPHGIAIEVTERRPIAIAELAGEYMAVGSGGRVMRGVQIDRSLPVLHVTHIDGDRLDDPAALGAIAILAAAPPVLRKRVSRVQIAGKGLMVNLRNGPTVYFGSKSRPVAKWMAAARVLAEPSAAGAVYLDVRVPGRVAAGGLGTLPQDLADPLAQGTQAQTADPQPTPESTTSLNP
jgi:cell division protein FtsQ